MPILVVVALVVVGFAAGWLGASLRPTQYTSTSILEWDPSTLRYANADAYVPDSQSLAIQVQAQADRVKSDAVIDPAADALHVKADDLRDDVEVSIGTSTTQILISGTSDSPSSARALTAAVVTSYSNDVSGTLRTQFSDQADALQPAVDALTKQLASLPAGSALATPLATQLADDTSQQISLRAQAEAAATPLSVMRAAPQPLVPSSPSSRTLAVVGAALGFLIGLGVVLILRLRSEQMTRPAPRAGASRSSSRVVPESV